MIEFNCDCGEFVVKGEMAMNENNKPRFYIWNKPKGAIITNNSKDPKDWIARCGECQSKKDKKGKNV